MGTKACSRGRIARWALALAGVAVGWSTLSGSGAIVHAQRPSVAGRTAGVSTGHPLTTAAALEILLAGGNAFDSGVASLLVGGVVEKDLYSLGGEALVLVYPAAEGKVASNVGQGWAPKKATIEWYRDRGRDLAGARLDPAVVPGALHVAADSSRALGHNELRAGGGPGDRVCRTRVPAASEDGSVDRA